MRNSIIAVFVSLTFAADAWATPMIVVGSHAVLPNTPNQFIDIMVKGGDRVAGVNFNAQVADGGPEVGGVILGPSITGHILPSGPPGTTFNPFGSIFQPNNTGEQDVSGGLSQFLGLITTTSSGTVAANGLLARLTIDTTGFTSGSWALKLADTINGNTDFAGFPINIEDGDIHIVGPEPVTNIIVSVGDHYLNPNQANQEIKLFVQPMIGSEGYQYLEAVTGMDLNVQIGDGGPGVGGVDVTPTLTGDILTGTIFAGDNTGATYSDSGNQALFVSTSTASGGTVGAGGLIATLLIDTTGFSSGTWPLYVATTANGDTYFSAVSGEGTTLWNGSITIVPEPTTSALAALGIVGAMACVRRRARCSGAT